MPEAGVDYEAVWQIDPETLTRHCLVSVDVAHAETCTFEEGFHWHGRNDVPCELIATIDDRPDWADNY